MKKVMFIAIAFFAFQMQAQLVQGELKVKEQSKVELEMKGNKVVNLYAAFREKSYPIHFIFTGIDIPANSDKKEVVPEGGFEPPTPRFSIVCSTN